VEEVEERRRTRRKCVRGREIIKIRGGGRGRKIGINQKRR
jgi:hypothetical protein